ncbi:MAG: hypothetical protein RI967_1469, partial [Planctomycetota bacterium]
MPDLSAWLLTFGAFGAIVVLTAVAAKAVAGDPAGARRRCPRCWHELGPAGADGAASRRCTECGHEAADERATARTRRFPMRAAGAFAGIVAIALVARARVFDQGPWSVVPTGVLLAATPHLPGGGYRSAAWELAQRIGQRKASDAQLEEAFDLFLAGDAGARPPAEAWRTKYRDLGTALATVLGRDDPRLDRLLGIPPAITVLARAGDGEGPGLLVIDADTWWPRGTEARATIRIGNGEPVTAAFVPSARSNPLVLELPEGATPDTPVEVAFEARPPRRALGAERPWHAYEAVSDRVLARKADAPALSPVDTPELREAIAAAFDEGLLLYERGSPRAGLRFNHRSTDGEAFEGIAVALRIEVCEEGAVRRTSRIWWRAGPFGSDALWLPSVEDEDALGRFFTDDPALDTRWTLRIA